MDSSIILPLLSRANPEYSNLADMFQNNIGNQNTIELLKLSHPEFLHSCIFQEYNDKRLRFHNLKDKYILDLLEDLTHRYIFNDIIYGLPLEAITRLSKETFIGYTMEAFVVRKINNEYDNTVLRHVYKWLKRNSNLPSSEDVKNIVAVGLGSLYCKNLMPDEFSEVSRMDVALTRQDNDFAFLFDIGLGRSLSMQVKAVKSKTKVRQTTVYLINYLRRKLMSNNPHSPAYRNVLTLLRMENGVHTKKVIIDSIMKFLDQRQIVFGIDIKALDIESLVSCPQDIGLDQAEIDEYYEFLSYIHEHPRELAIDNIDVNIKNALLFHSLTKTEPVRDLKLYHSQVRHGIIL